jgi:hypothetical protein
LEEALDLSSERLLMMMMMMMMMIISYTVRFSEKVIEHKMFVLIFCTNFI